MEREAFFELADNLIRVGRVSAIKVDERTAQVIYEDRGEERNMVSAWLKVLENQPYIHAEMDVDGQWSRTASYATCDRELGYSGESFDAELPETIELSKTYPYPTNCDGCSQTGALGHTLRLEIRPWMPKIGQMVVCLFLPAWQGNGFILGAY